MHSNYEQKNATINKINVALVTSQELLMRVNCEKHATELVYSKVTIHNNQSEV